MKQFKMSSLLVIVFLIISHCDEKNGVAITDPDDTEGAGDADADSDVDGDVDADTDTDIDGDVDGDVDGDSDGDTASDSETEDSTDTETATEEDLGRCGGLSTSKCKDDEYCYYTLQESCGAADQMGFCRKRPEGCDEIYAPVCGCDGQTYSNECEANAAGFAISKAEPCPNCGGKMGLTCANDEFCAFKIEQNCGDQDQMSYCEARPTSCDDVVDPVCGCDGQTYTNECESNAAGFAIRLDTECP